LVLLVFVAARRRTTPLVVSSVEPTGIWRPSEPSGTKPLAFAPAPAGSLTSTVPFTGTALTDLPSTGSGSGAGPGGASE
jgi:hypothetical protein